MHWPVSSKTCIEKSGIDGLVNGVGRMVSYGSRQLRLLQSGQVGNYILIMVLAMVVFFLIWFNDVVSCNFSIKYFKLLVAIKKEYDPCFSHIDPIGCRTG
jgi:hypothetical protein